jgi:hypothetical protein
MQDYLENLILASNFKKEDYITARLNYSKVSPGAYRAQYQLEHFVKNCGLEVSLCDKLSE